MMALSETLMYALTNASCAKLICDSAELCSMSTKPPTYARLRASITVRTVLYPRLVDIWKSPCTLLSAGTRIAVRTVLLAFPLFWLPSTTKSPLEIVRQLDDMRASSVMVMVMPMAELQLTRSVAVQTESQANAVDAPEIESDCILLKRKVKKITNMDWMGSMFWLWRSSLLLS